MNQSEFALKPMLKHWFDDFSAFKNGAVWLFLLLVSVFYLLTAAGNLSETDDVFAFAYRAENFAYSHVSDPRLMLYHMLMRGLYLLTNTVMQPFNVDISALTSMRLFSAVCASLSLYLLFRIIIINLKLRPTTALITVCLLGFSYGFWRYAVEAEVYIPAIMLCLLVFHLLHNASIEKTALACAVGILSGLTILFYQPAVIPLLFAFPFLLLTKTAWKSLLVYGVSATLVVVIGYLVGYWLYWPNTFSPTEFAAFLSQRSEEFMVPSLSIKTVIVSVIRAIFAIGHDFTSANWIFSLPFITDVVQKVFPQNVLQEEIFMARHLGWLVYPLMVLQLALISIVCWLVWRGCRLLKQLRMTRSGWVILGWLVINGAIIGRLNPGGIEAWIMVFPAIMLMVALVVIEPLIQDHKTIIVSCVILLLIQNSLGGMAMVHDAKHDFHQAKGKWIIENSRPEDLVIIAGDASMTEALRYLAAAQVVNISLFDRNVIALGLLSARLEKIQVNTRGRDFSGMPLSVIVRKTLKNHGRIIVFEEFFGGPKERSNEILMRLKNNSLLQFESTDTSDTYIIKTQH
ncbi:hypothetical protein [Aliiglaciecola litoralis]|uniref:Glycosyltransferase RgtA/B/C/D-like domain-containing protein n=1 Tax=Aliiglaciecola litoralis TaxID=582857 RepID=A0ABP3WTS1_9ALTE